MGRVKRTVVFYKCERCGHEWLPRTEGSPPPKVCPNPRCKSPYWDTPKKSAVKPQKAAMK